MTGPGEERVLRARRSNVVAREVRNQTVVLDLKGSVYLTLNASGAALWQALTAGATRRQLVQALLHRFDVEVDQATRDVDAFLRRCAQADLLDDGAAPAPSE